MYWPILPLAGCPPGDRTASNCSRALVSHPIANQKRHKISFLGPWLHCGYEYVRNIGSLVGFKTLQMLGVWGVAWAGSTDAKGSMYRTLCQTLGAMWFMAHILWPPSVLGGGQGSHSGLGVGRTAQNTGRGLRVQHVCPHCVGEICVYSENPFQLRV
jgi:hypothetical protein